MNKTFKILAAAAIVALLGAGCAKSPATNANNNAPKPAGYSRANPASGMMTVKITADGEFDPTTAFVKKGTVVTFENDSRKAHNIVPVKDAGKEFTKLDSKGSIEPGGKFTVTLDQTGRWLYADGTNLAFSGAVEVTE